MIGLFKLLTLVFDILFLFLLSFFSLFFYLKVSNSFFLNFIPFITSISFIIKLFYLYLLIIKYKSNEEKNYQSYFFVQVGFSTIFYLTPIYYLNQYPNLVISDLVIFITLNLIILLFLIGIILQNISLTNLSKKVT